MGFRRLTGNRLRKIVGQKGLRPSITSGHEKVTRRTYDNAGGGGEKKREIPLRVDFCKKKKLETKVQNKKKCAYHVSANRSMRGKMFGRICRTGNRKVDS